MLFANSSGDEVILRRFWPNFFVKTPSHSVRSCSGRVVKKKTWTLRRCQPSVPLIRSLRCSPMRVNGNVKSTIIQSKRNLRICFLLLVEKKKSSCSIFYLDGVPDGEYRSSWNFSHVQV